MCQYFIYFYCSIIFHYMDRPQFTCVAIDIDRFVLNPAPTAAIISSSSAGLEGQRYRMGWGALLCNSGVQGRRPAFGCRGWGPKAEARRGGVGPHTWSPLPRTFTLSQDPNWSGAASLFQEPTQFRNLFAWQRSRGSRWGIKVISKSFHR